MRNIMFAALVGATSILALSAQAQDATKAETTAQQDPSKTIEAAASTPRTDGHTITSHNPNASQKSHLDWKKVEPAKKTGAHMKKTSDDVPGED
ncbi:hypothetical protein [Dyella koreensis]|uniref:Acid-shock protein n=1 Tax=Dyella koreensis TaxID=311235 RepID=A0ABW8K5I3_9GAMM